jgi:hypothetical protein
MRRRMSEKYGKRFIILDVEDTSNEFKLLNGYLFFLHPVDDKLDQVRLSFDKKCLTCFWHGSKV